MAGCVEADSCPCLEGCGLRDVAWGEKKGCRMKRAADVDVGAPGASALPGCRDALQDVAGLRVLEKSW